MCNMPELGLPVALAGFASGVVAAGIAARYAIGLVSAVGASLVLAHAIERR